jgi:hypothetical protein
MQNTSDAEFFIRFIEGRVWVLVDFDERMRVRYVDYENMSRPS